MTGAELADELDFWLADLRAAKAAWDEKSTDLRWSRYETVKCSSADWLQTNGAAILAALRAERPEVEAGADAVERVARAIEGPHDHGHLTPEKLAELREFRWKMLGAQMQSYRRIQARAAIAALHPADPGPGVEEARQIVAAYEAAMAGAATADHKLAVMANYGDLALQLLPTLAAPPPRAHRLPRAEVEREIVTFMETRAKQLRGGPLGGEVEATMAEDFASAIERGEHRAALAQGQTGDALAGEGEQG